MNSSVVFAPFLRLQVLHVKEEVPAKSSNDHHKENQDRAAKACAYSLFPFHLERLKLFARLLKSKLARLPKEVSGTFQVFWYTDPV